MQLLRTEQVGCDSHRKPTGSIMLPGRGHDGRHSWESCRFREDSIPYRNFWKTKHNVHARKVFIVGD